MNNASAIDLMQYCRNRNEKALQTYLNLLDEACLRYSTKTQKVIQYVKKKVIEDFQKPIQQQASDEDYAKWQETLNEAIIKDICHDMVRLFEENGKAFIKSQKVCFGLAYLVNRPKLNGKLSKGSPLALYLENEEIGHKKVYEQYLQTLDNFKRFFSAEFNTYIGEYKEWLKDEIKKPWTEKSSYKMHSEHFKKIKKLLKSEVKSK